MNLKNIPIINFFFILYYNNMNKKLAIIILIVSLIILYLLYRLYIKIRYKYLKKIFIEPRNAKKDLIVDANSINTTSDGYPLSWSLSIWIYIDDWSYRYNAKKYIIKWDNCSIWLSKRLTDLNISLPTHDNKIETIVTKDIPIQKWLHLCVSLDNRNLDVWVNGELHNSKYLKNVPLLTESNLTLTPDGGFSGYLSRFRFYSKPLPKVRLIDFDTVTNLFDLGPFCKYPLLCKIMNLWTTIKGSIKIDVNVSGDVSNNYN